MHYYSYVCKLLLPVGHLYIFVVRVYCNTSIISYIYSVYLHIYSLTKFNKKMRAISCNKFSISVTSDGQDFKNIRQKNNFFVLLNLIYVKLVRYTNCQWPQRKVPTFLFLFSWRFSRGEDTLAALLFGSCAITVL
jgi:hypothetical protein